MLETRSGDLHSQTGPCLVSTRLTVTPAHSALRYMVMSITTAVCQCACVWHCLQQSPCIRLHISVDMASPSWCLVPVTVQRFSLQPCDGSAFLL